MSAQALLYCINKFALQNTNPVLSILPETGVVKYKQKYPQPMLSFSGNGLRAYYHCHTSVSQTENEHGHFHIFINTGNDQWSHLVGLSIDNLGQPVQWFTVNHWVTGESWVSAEKLKQHLYKLIIKDTQDTTLVEDWLLGMLEFYQQSINNLLKSRDQRIEELAQEMKLEKILKDHAIYDLSKDKINLLRDLETYVRLDNNSLTGQYPSIQRGI